MNKLLTFGIDHLDEELFKPVSNYTDYDCRNKPMGGLWASSYKPDNHYPSEWVEFIDTGLSDKFKVFTGITYQLKPGIKILKIDTANDYFDALDKYGIIPFPNIDTKLQLDFESMSKDYDAFHLTSDGAYLLRFLSGEAYHLARDFYSYDVESYILFNLDCIDKDSIETITLPDDFWTKEEDD